MSLPLCFSRVYFVADNLAVTNRWSFSAKASALATLSASGSSVAYSCQSELPRSNVNTARSLTRFLPNVSKTKARREKVRTVIPSCFAIRYLTSSISRETLSEKLFSRETTRCYIKKVGAGRSFGPLVLEISAWKHPIGTNVADQALK